MIDIYPDLKEAVITTSDIILGKKSILYIHHDEYDEKYDGEEYIAWQFLDENTETFEKLKIVAIKKVIDIDQSIPSILKKIPPGYMAYRENIKMEWKIKKYEDE